MGARSSFRIEQAKVLLRSGSTVREAAQALALTEGHFRAIFKEETGISPVEYRRAECPAQPLRTLSARVPEDEYQAVQKLAREADMKLSAYVRHRLKGPTEAPQPRSQSKTSRLAGRAGRAKRGTAPRR